MRFKWLKGLLLFAGIAVVPVIAAGQTDTPDNPESTAAENPAPTPHEVVATASTAIAEQLVRVLGDHWRNATEEQRTRFVDVFYRFLVQSYADGILGFEQDSLTILPPDGDLDEKRAIVKTTIRMEDGTEVPVNYSMRNSSAGWRVYDVRIEGVSYIQNYRNQLNAEIAALGLDAVIDRLQAEVSASEAPKDS
jgi:ABC-type transporter MlaC component